MIPALIRFVLRLGGERGALAIGLPEGPSLDAIHALGEDRARGIAEAARTDGLRDPAALPDLLGLDAADLEGRAAVVMAGRDAGWHLPDLLDLLPYLVAATRRVVVVARPGSLAGDPARLERMLAERGVPPLLTGIAPANDPYAPGCPVAIIDPAANGGAPAATGAIVRFTGDTGLALDTLRWLASEGIPAVVVGDEMPGVRETIRAGDGVIGWFSGDDADEEAMNALDASGASWVLDLAAGERLRAPFPGRSIAESLAIAESLGHGSVLATIIDNGPPVDSHEPGTGYWRFAPGPAAFGRVVARRTHGDETSSSPYNLLLVRPSPWLAPGAAGVTREPLALFEDRRAGLVERLSGFGVFDLTYPTPPGLRWTIEETIHSWHGNVLKAGVGRLPHPDPMDPVPGACLVRWDTLDATPASLTVKRGDGPERFIARGASGTVTIDGLQPGVVETLRLATDGPRPTILAEMRLWFDFDPGW